MTEDQSGNLWFVTGESPNIMANPGKVYRTLIALIVVAIVLLHRFDNK